MTNIHKPQVIILAAGEGSRLRPYTESRPKCLVEVDGQSLLDRHLHVLRSEGVSDVAVITGYHGEQLSDKGLKVFTNPRYAETNMVWTLFCAESALNQETIIAYGDIVYSRTNLRALLSCKADVAVVVDKDWECYWRTRFENPLDDAETLKFSIDGALQEIGQKPKNLSEIQGQYIGLMKFSAKGLGVLKEVFHECKANGSLGGRPIEKAYMTDMLQALIDRGCRVEPVTVHGQWVEVDNATDLNLPLTRERLELIASE
jgi:choline kinase